MTGEPSERHPIDELAEDFVARYRRGERPSVTEVAQKYPAWAGQLLEVLQTLVLMEELGPAQDSRSGVATGAAPLPAQVPLQLGEYRILREIGHGGMGIVYEAEQESLGRHVALKVLPFHALMAPVHLERFRREARAAARLHHTNIVPVFGVGEQDGVHY
jgi:serine/threonine protein kinase